MPSENLAGRTIAGYRLLKRVGEGGTAEVYRAEHPERGACAFKVLRSRLASDPTVVKRFLREAGYGSRVQHPGVVRTYDYGEADGLYYLALEWADGKPLAVRTPRGSARSLPGCRRGPATGRGTHGGTPGGDHPSRPEAGEHRLRRHATNREAARFRDRSGRRVATGGAAHAHGLLRRNAQVRRAGSAVGGTGGRARRH